VSWEEYENGWLAETKHGFFFVYQMLNLWYVEYETASETYGRGFAMPLTQHGFANEGAAKAHAEKYANSLNVIPNPDPLEEE
jgi:hypothetical protein